MRTLILAIAALLPISTHAQTPFRPDAVGRYQIFQQVDGLYAFDTQSGEVYFLKLVRGERLLDANQLVWVKLSKPIAEAVNPNQIAR